MYVEQFANTGFKSFCCPTMPLCLGVEKNTYETRKKSIFFFNSLQKVYWQTDGRSKSKYLHRTDLWFKCDRKHCWVDHHWPLTPEQVQEDCRSWQWNWQGKFFSPVWVLLWVFKSEVLAKLFAQTSQIWSLMWTRLIWFFKTMFVMKIFPQWTHSNPVFWTDAFTAWSISETMSPPSIWGELSVVKRNGIDKYFDGLVMFVQSCWTKPNLKIEKSKRAKYNHEYQQTGIK